MNECFVVSCCRGIYVVYVHAQVYDFADVEIITSLHSNREQAKAPKRVQWQIECDDGLKIISLSESDNFPSQYSIHIVKLKKSNANLLIPV